MDNLNGFTVFLQMAEVQSFVAAGRAIGISSSAVSKSIARLEERIGVRLFHRSTRSVRLTSEGEVFLERCRVILNEIRAAEQELSTMAQTARGRLRVSLPFAAGLILPTLSNFMKLYPEIELDLDFTDRFVDVIDEGLDVVIRAGELGDSRLMSRRLGAYRVCLVGAPSYFKSKGEPQRPDDLIQHACLHYRFQSTGKLNEWPLRHSNVASGAGGLPRTMVSSNLDALVHMVREGHGIACVPDFAVKQSLMDGTLRTILDTYMTRSTTFRILWPSSRQMAPKVRVFVDYVVEHFSQRLVSRSGSKRKV